MKPFSAAPLRFLSGIAGIAALCFSGLLEAGEKHGASRGVPVIVAAAIQKDIPVQIPAIGSVEAYSTVSVKSRVCGELSRVYFQEGQEVKKGDLLFAIDSRSFRACLKQSEANLACDIAQMKKAEIDAGRYAELLKNGVVSKQEYDQYRTNYEALAATVKADEAAVMNAKLQLGYCSIRSPVNGRVGKLLANEGNIVKDNDTVLVTINQTKPIYVTFFLPEQDLPGVRKYMARGKLKVEVNIPQNKEDTATGELTFVNNEVDVTTGTVMLKAVFPNDSELLWPKQFVMVTLTLTTQCGAVTVPEQAVQTGQEGQYVFVVRPDRTVEFRPVISGVSYGQEVVVAKGLSPGEIVVTDGQLLLVPGSTIEIKSGP